ncbi:MAG TPA: MFS transporter [Acidobacteriota bacterium]|jgi:FSR family fosmidomycin resistance protein-like MFS transporter
MRINKSVLALAAGHFLIDNYSSMLGAFLPFLHEQLKLSMAQAGLLGGALTFSSSLMQPLYGLLADRFQSKIFAALAPAIAGVFIASLGLAPNFSALLILLVLGGVGIAAFHPQGAAITSEVSGRDQGYQMSVFITGGMIGYAFGPIFITLVITLAGLHHSYWAALPGVAVSAYLLLNGPSPRRVEAHSRRLRFTQQLRSKLRPLLLLYFLVVIRSAIQIVFVSFLPLYLTTRGYSAAQGSQMLTAFLLAGGSAGFVGGVLADRFGGKTIIALSMLGCLPFLLGFLWTKGPLALLLCVAGGAFLLFTTPVNIVMAQKLVPEGASTVSALMMGFAWGIGGLFVPLTGLCSDFFGMQATMASIVLLAIPGLILSLALPPNLETTGQAPHLEAISELPSS